MTRDLIANIPNSSFSVLPEYSGIVKPQTQTVNCLQSALISVAFLIRSVTSAPAAETKVGCGV